MVGSKMVAVEMQDRVWVSGPAKDIRDRRRSEDDEYDGRVRRRGRSEMAKAYGRVGFRTGSQARNVPGYSRWRRWRRWRLWRL